MPGNTRLSEIKRQQLDELFRLVMLIKDRQLQNEIIAALNALKFVKPTNSRSTQTVEQAQEMNIVKDAPVENRLIKLKYSENPRKRKRSKKGPVVISSKRSSVEIVSNVVVTQPPVEPATTSEFPSIFESPPLLDVDFVMDPRMDLSDIERDAFPDKNDMEYIEKKMIEEFIACYKLVNGFYPIQVAIMEHDFKLFQRQLYVLNARKIDLNDIFTEENQNLLELAIMSKCPLKYFDHLINYGMKFDIIDNSNNNNILDVIACSSDDEKLFSYFLRKLPIDLLRDVNADGSAVLHSLVKKNQFKMIHVLLNHIDEVLKLKPLKFEESSVIECQKEMEELYKKAFPKIIERREIHKMKCDILNLQDEVSGQTPLLVALSSQYTHIAYMLLNHLADPSIKEYSGSDYQTYLVNKNKTKDKQLEDVITKVLIILSEMRKCS